MQNSRQKFKVRSPRSQSCCGSRTGLWRATAHATSTWKSHTSLLEYKSCWKRLSGVVAVAAQSRTSQNKRGDYLAQGFHLCTLILRARQVVRIFLYTRTNVDAFTSTKVQILTHLADLIGSPQESLLPHRHGHRNGVLSRAHACRFRRWVQHGFLDIRIYRLWRRCRAVEQHAAGEGGVC